MLKYIFMALFTGVVLIQTPALAQKNAVTKKQPDQEEADTTFRDKLFFGGYLWATFNQFQTSVEVAPQVGYHLSERLDVGVGAKYMYSYSRSLLRDTNLTRRTSNHIFGGNVFTSFVAIKNLNKILPFKFKGRLVVHLEYEALNLPNKDYFDIGKSGNRFWLNNYFVGGGLRQQIGEGSFVSLLVLYNLNEKGRIIYNNNPIIRISFGF